MRHEPENHAMHKPLITAMLLSAVLLAGGADGKPKEPAGSQASEKATAKDGKKEGKDADKQTSNVEKKPACMHCGATCCLTPVCVCEPGTKKKPKAEFSVTCEPMCVAGCSSKPRLFGHCEQRPGCTNCCAEPCRCPGWVRTCKKLSKETVDEEVPTVKRTVAYICDCCAGRCSAGCRQTKPHPRASSWWTQLTSWL
jgi:hypothetical protein